IVRKYVNGSVLRRTGDDVGEVFDKGGTRVPRYRLAEHFARLRVEGSKQRQGAVPVVLEPVSLGASRRRRQHRTQTVERLNGRFLIDGEQDRGIWRIDVEPDHVGGLRFEVGIVRLHLPLESMRLET